MALSFSTPLRNQLLTTGSLKSLLDGRVIRIYGGPVPGGSVPADTALSQSNNPLLVEITVNASGTGLTWQSPASGGTLVKNASEVWEGTVLVTGEPTFFRIEGQGDTGGTATSEARVQGTAGPGARDLVLTSNVLTAGNVRRLGFAQITLPPM